VQREAALKAQVEALEAQIRDLTQRLYGKKSEKSTGSEALRNGTFFRVPTLKALHSKRMRRGITAAKIL
jgi:hypothetical protein